MSAVNFSAMSQKTSETQFLSLNEAEIPSTCSSWAQREKNTPFSLALVPHAPLTLTHQEMGSLHLGLRAYYYASILKKEKISS